MKSQKSDNKVQSQGEGGAPPPPGTGAMAIITMATSVPKEQAKGKARAVCWTMFNHEDKLVDLRVYAAECKYMVWGREVCPTTGRIHLQGYTSFKNPQSMGEFAKRFQCHTLKAKGSALQNRVYCTKDGQFEEFGEIPKQGRRTDWEDAVEMVQEGEKVVDVIERFPHMVPNIRALDNMRERRLLPLHREVSVYVIWGSSGIGKTRYAYEKYPDLFPKPTPKQSGTWWNGYDGQKVVLFDDFYGEHIYSDLLRVLDRYPYSAPICGGGYVWAQWDTVIITSNKHPREWYRFGLTPALRRRLTKIVECKVIDGSPVYEEEARDQEAEELPSPPRGAPQDDA